MKEIEDLIKISQRYGKDNRYVIAGGGNTSFKTTDKLWVKASGHSLSTITEEGFAVMDRKKLDTIASKEYSSDAIVREEEVKTDLAAANITKERRPSVETSMHNALSASYVVHLHPTLVNGLMCSVNAEAETQKLFGDAVLYIPYSDPGYLLFKKVVDGINSFKSVHGKEPAVILLQNHGIFVGADTTEEVETIYGEVIKKIEKITGKLDEYPEKQVVATINDIIPAIRMLVSKDNLKTLKVRNNDLIERFTASEDEFMKIAVPFTPDGIVYCKSVYLYLDAPLEMLFDVAAKKIEEYIVLNGFTPKVLLIKGVGLVAVGDNAAGCDIILDVYEDMMKTALVAFSFGGGHPMERNWIEFIDNWEVENYRRKVSNNETAGRVVNKTVVITGAAMGFGEGIARCLIKEGANIVVADLNEEAGKETVKNLNAIAGGNRAVFAATNVAETDSLDKMLTSTIASFGGIDVFISNAGVLYAGGLEEMTPERFDFVTKINYNAFFYCTRAVSKIMKLQNRYDRNRYFDIIQINSKSGLKGSKANFAYSGGKFGGIGLTQSFALELAPFRIKVNAICPGNYYEGPLWSNPENGLFIQYLKSGKVPGAKNIDDVRDYYMSQVPMGKGTNPEDVTKAILYAIEQTCETGQAIPVTGGQIMLS
jgi:rhamnose utilization protein RhaD (predicted bifunctional aldolase and dehydrogenase)/NAD(P)-dependent dehydrogenase (short-subunit alcohol dehydrogenase family)